MRKALAALPCLALLWPLGASTSCGLDQRIDMSAGGSMDPPIEPKLNFEPSVPLQLEPGKSAILEVRLDPPQVTEIRFGIVGDSLNEGSLSADRVTTGSDGRARVTLFAPSTPGSLSVRAAWEDASRDLVLNAERPIVIGSLGFGAVVITLDGADSLEVSEWRASCFAGFTCTELTSLEGNTPLFTTGTAPLSLTDLPAGTPLAIVVRGGNIARGCATVMNLGRDEVRPVMVPVSPLPFDVRGKLRFSLQLKEIEQNLFDAVASSLAAEVPTDSWDKYWLDTVLGLTPSAARATFAKRREEAQLDQIVKQAFERTSGVEGALLLELNELLHDLEAKGEISGRLDLDKNPASFDVTSCAGVPASTALAKNPVPWRTEVSIDGAWTTNAELMVRLLPWLRDLAYLEEAGLDTSVAEKLANTANCTEVASALAEALPDEQAYPGCGRTCLGALCEDAFGALWDRLGSGDATVKLDLAQSGTLERDADGALKGLSGSFIASEADKITLRGEVMGGPL